MKRWVSGAMAFIITFSCAQGSFAFASGDADDAAASALMEHCPEDAPAADAADEVFFVAPLPEEAESVPTECELTLGDEEDIALTAETDAPAVVDDPAEAQAADAPRYARTCRADVAVLEAVEGAMIAALGADSTVLVLEEAAADWLWVAFCTERGVVTGCVAADGMRVLDADETAAYLDALVTNNEVTVYDGDLNRPLEQVACAFADAAEASVDDAVEDAVEVSDENADTANDDTADTANDDTAAEVSDENADTANDDNADEVTEDAVTDAEADGEDAPAGNGDAANADEGAADGEANADESAENGEKSEADEAKSEADEAKSETDEAKSEADEAKSETDEAKSEADEAKSETDEAKSEADEADAPKADVPAMEAVAAEGRVDGAAEASQAEADTSAKADAGTAASQESTAAEAAFQLNMTQCVLGLRETYHGLSATGGSGSVVWTSSNKKIVRVDANTGVIKGLKKGKATVTATCGGATASVLVTVKNAPKKLRFKPKKLTMGAGGAPVQLRLGMGKGAASAGVAYASSNDGVASVDANGMLTAKSAGTAVITAVTYNRKKATCKVTVYATPAPARIALPARISIGVKESRAALPLSMVSAAGDQNCTAQVTWKSTNKKVLKVDPKTGAIRALKKGTATIVAKTDNGLRARCKVKVKKAPKKVTLSPSNKSLEAGGTMQYAAKLPKGSAGACAYTSSNPGVATIDENGLAKAVSTGTTTITVTTYNGKTATAKLTVASKVEITGSKSGVKVPESLEKLGLASYQNVYSADLTNAQKLEHVIYNAQNQLGKKYTYGGGYSGGSNPSGFDCSGLVYWCFGKINVRLKDSAHKQGYDQSYLKVVEIDKLKRGDVVCFNTDENEKDQNDLSDHTGIYLGNGYFIHASSSAGKVVVSQFASGNSDFYKRNFSWGRRILD